jgi:hypothetical protein
VRFVQGNVLPVQATRYTNQTLIIISTRKDVYVNIKSSLNTRMCKQKIFYESVP